MIFDGRRKVKTNLLSLLILGAAAAQHQVAAGAAHHHAEYVQGQPGRGYLLAVPLRVVFFTRMLVVFFTRMPVVFFTRMIAAFFTRMRVVLFTRMKVSFSRVLFYTQMSLSLISK